MWGAAASGIPSFGDLAWKAPVRVAPLGGLPASTYSAGVLTANANGALPALDGVSLSVGDRLLQWDRSTASENGIYVVTSLGSGASRWVLTRSADCDEAADMVQGLAVVAIEGTYNGGKWIWSTAAWTPTSGAPAFATTQLRPSSSTAQFMAPGGVGPMIVKATAGTGSDARIWLGDLANPDDIVISMTPGGTLTITRNPSGNVALSVAGTIKQQNDFVVSVGAQAHGLQSGRVQVGASIAAAGSRVDTVTLPTAFADANYTPIVWPYQSGMTTRNVTMALDAVQVAASFDVRTQNNDTAARQPWIYWLAVHD